MMSSAEMLTAIWKRDAKYENEMDIDNDGHKIAFRVLTDNERHILGKFFGVRVTMMRDERLHAKWYGKKEKYLLDLENKARFENIDI